MPYAPTPRSRSEVFREDYDTRPKSHPCNKCARDVENGNRCSCVASMPFSFIPEGEYIPRPFIVRL